MDELLFDELTLSVTDDDRISMEFRLIAAGRFHMGARGEYFDEEPVHTVEITQPFYLGIYPVTQEQFAVWRPQHENGFPGNAQHPAEDMDWNAANAFCQWLSERCSSEIPIGYSGGLPTEAQWEFACRAGTDTEYHSGDGGGALADAGWFDGNAQGTTHPVGHRQMNDFGLYDMHGNVDEWCWDDYVADAYKSRVDGIRDPIIPARDVSERDSNAFRVIRGGSWAFSAGYCRAAYRFGRWPAYRFGNLGFRVCLFPGPVPSQQEPEQSRSLGPETQQGVKPPRSRRTQA